LIRRSDHSFDHRGHASNSHAVLISTTGLQLTCIHAHRAMVAVTPHAAIASRARRRKTVIATNLRVGVILLGAAKAVTCSALTEVSIGLVVSCKHTRTPVAQATCSPVTEAVKQSGGPVVAVGWGLNNHHGLNNNRLLHWLVSGHLLRVHWLCHLVFNVIHLTSSFIR